MNVKKFLERYGPWVVCIIAAVISIIATAYFYHHHQILAYNDARSRLNIARRVTDSLTPGIVQIGTVWLPLDQLLMIPFVMSHYLWTTGLAGSIVSMGAFVIGTLYIYRLVMLLTRSVWLSLLGSGIFMLNLNVLYLQSTAMTEVLMLATLAGATYYMVRWLQERHTLDLVYAGSWIFLAILNRYEGWFMLAIATAIVYVNIRLTKHNKDRAEGEGLLLATVGAFAVFIWLLWNLLFWGNPLYFLTGEGGQYSVSGHSSLARHHLLTAITTLWKALAFNVSFGLLIVCMAAIIVLAMRKRRHDNHIAPYVITLLFAPIAFNLITLFMGITAIGANSLQDLFNVRYGISIVSLAAVAIPYAAMYLPRPGKVLVATGTLLCLLTVPPSAYYGAIHGGRSLSAHAAEFVTAFHQKYKGGIILATSSAPYSQIEQALGIPLKNYVSQGNYHIWDRTLAQPQTKARYVLMSGKGTSGDLVYKAYLQHKALYDTYYTPIYQKNTYTVLERTSYVAKPRTVTKKVVDTASSVDVNHIVHITVARGDSQTSIVESQIALLDPHHHLSGVQVVFVTHEMVQELGKNNMVYPGQSIAINRDELRRIIAKSSRLTAEELTIWQPYVAVSQS